MRIRKTSTDFYLEIVSFLKCEQAYSLHAREVKSSFYFNFSKKGVMRYIYIYILYKYIIYIF